jgi:hypothetical protein
MAGGFRDQGIKGLNAILGLGAPESATGSFRNRVIDDMEVISAGR